MKNNNNLSTCKCIIIQIQTIEHQKVHLKYYPLFAGIQIRTRNPMLVHPRTFISKASSLSRIAAIFAASQPNQAGEWWIDERNSKSLGDQPSNSNRRSDNNVTNHSKRKD